MAATIGQIATATVRTVDKVLAVIEPAQRRFNGACGARANRAACQVQEMAVEPGRPNGLANEKTGRGNRRDPNTQSMEARFAV